MPCFSFSFLLFSFDKCSLMKSVWFPLYLKGMGCCLCVSASRMAILPYSSFQQDKKASTQYVTFVNTFCCFQLFCLFFIAENARDAWHDDGSSALVTRFLMQVTFDGERTVKGFYQFLKRNAAIPFSLPKPSQSQQNSPAAPVSATIEKTSSGEQLKDEL